MYHLPSRKKVITVTGLLLIRNILGKERRIIFLEYHKIHMLYEKHTNSTCQTYRVMIVQSYIDFKNKKNLT